MTLQPITKISNSVPAALEPRFERILNEVVQRVVRTAQPERIILFGSAARGQLSPDGDLDLLVIKSGVNRRRLAAQLYRSLVGVGCPVDIVVVTPEDIDRYGLSPALVLEPALREGKEVYAA